MSETVKRLLDRRANLVTQMREVAERAVDEDRPMSADEDRQFTEMNSEVDALQKRADAMLEGEKRAKDIEESFATLSGKPKERNTPTDDKANASLRSFMIGEGDRTYSIPAGPAPRRNKDGLWTFEEQRADQTTSTASGVVPTGFRAQLWEYMIEESGILSAGVDLLETASGETIKLPRATAHSAAGAVTEGSAISASDPTLSSVNSTVTKEGYTTQLSTELVTDSGVDLTGYLARSAGRALGNAVGAAAVTAAVAAASAGATTAAGELTTLGSQATVGKGFDYLITLFYSVIDPYRRRSSCAWLTSDAGAAMLRKVKDSAGQYIWIPSVLPGQPDTILGKPVYIDTNVADPGANAESVLFGDFSSLVVRIAGGFRFERSDEFAFGDDLVTYRALVRHGSVSIDANALKSLTHPAI
jgi:HK97 family phage major capsid protein